MEGFVVKINDGIDWRYVAKSGFSYTLHDARVFKTESEANAIMFELKREEGVSAHVNRVFV